MRSCPACHAEAADDATFCPRCGTPLAAACATCGAPLSPGARFCSSCGAPVEQPEPFQERKLVTVLFADVTGYTGLGERLDAEQLREVMDAYFAAMREAIEAQGGTVEKFIGDAVMAVFGAPVAHEDDPARALRAAIGMRAKLDEVNRSLRASHDLTLEMRVGVNSGEVMAVANPGPGTGLVTGDAVSVAARLEENAEPGEVLVAERVARATRGFTFADVRPLSLKGKGHPVRALRLLSEERISVERGIPGLRAPLVGRDSEIALLDSLFARVVAEGQPHLVTVYGDPGVGKSRLVAEFMQRIEARAPGPLIVSGRCLPYGEGVTYWPLAEILKTLAGVLDTDPPELAVEKIRKLGREMLTPDVADEPARATATLAYTVGVEDPEISFRDLSPRQVRIETHAAWRSFFSGLASDRPLVVLIEDIHWGDSALLDLLEELADKLEGSVLLVCPARPELTQRRPAWGGGKRNFSSIFLDPLSPDEAELLVGFLLAIDDLARESRERILERAEGNPFFLEEIIRHLIDEGTIVHEGGRWRATSGCDEVLIPDTVQGVLSARIDLLSPEEKRVVQTAAVVGRLFWAGPLRRLSADVADIDGVLDRLEGRELIRARLSSSIGGDREFIFKHVLTRDVAYESLPRRDRAAAHARVAAWLKETAGERRREFAELLAHHFTEAHRLAGADQRMNEAEIESLRSSAFEHVLFASNVARDRFVIEGATRLGEGALGLAKSGLERSAALEALGLAYQFDYRGDDSWRCLKQAVDEALAAGVEDDRHIARLCASALETPTRWPGSIEGKPPEDEARRYLDLGMSHGERIEGDSPELARMLVVKSLWLFGYPEGATDELFDQSDADGRRAADIAHRLGLPELESAGLDGAGSAWMLRGLYRQAEEIGARRLQLAGKIRDSWELGDLYAVHSWVQFMVGRYDRAIWAADEGVGRTQDFVPGVAMAALTWRALARFRLGGWDGALEDRQRIQELLGDRRSRIPMFASRPYGAAALIHEIRGNSAAADELMTILGRVEPDRDGTLGSSPWLTPLLIRRGRIREGLVLIDEALAKPRWPGMLGPMYETFCDALAEAGEWGRAREQAPWIRAYGERGGFQTMAFAVDRLEGREALIAGDEERAAELFSRSAGGFAEHGVLWEEALTLLLLAESLIDLGKRAEAEGALERAVAVFEGLGAARDVTRARDLLA